MEGSTYGYEPFMSRFVVVVNNPKEWPLDCPTGGFVITARDYLTDPWYSTQRNLKVFNLCRSYRYQATGYYVSLLASARGHHVFPNLATVHGVSDATLLRSLVDDQLDNELQRSLRQIKGDAFTLSVYFGRNVAKRHHRLAKRLFSCFPVPFMRAEIRRFHDGWAITRLRLIASNDIPQDHWPFVLESAQAFFSRNGSVGRSKRQPYRYELAILYNPLEVSAPSCPQALERFCAAAKEQNIRAELLTAEEFSRLSAFDGLFIRETTRVNHHTYRFSVRAATEGLVVIDDPTSILRCTNKVYLHELLERHHIRTPRSMIAHRDNIKHIGRELGFPVVLKEPDSGFSMGVVKAENEQELQLASRRFLKQSDLIIAQEYLPTAYDWRVGIIAGEVLFVCQYGMVEGHWQIIKRDDQGTSNGWHTTMAVADAPQRVVRLAKKAAALIGDGFYGVDIKEVGKTLYVIEVNDNPNVDAGVEDKVLGDALYARIIGEFARRLDALKGR